MALPGFGWPGQPKAPFLLSVVLYYALHRKTGVMLTAALLAGFLQDSTSRIPLGTSSACFAAAGWMAGRFRGLVATEALLTPALFGAAAAAGCALASYGLLAWRALAFWPAGRLAAKVLLSGALGVGSTVVAFGIVGLLDRVVGNVETRAGQYDAG